MSDMQAAAEFERARVRAFLRDVWATLSGRPNRLLAWEKVRSHLRLGGQVYRGIQTVPVKKIVGSVNRYRDFDRAFLPRQSHTADRWKSISRAFYNDADLPPVKLYKVDDVYFVLDGNHRVSVAREHGREFIDAEVIEARTRVPIDGERLDADALEIIGEYADFLERTRLDELRPDQRIEFTVGGGYRRLLEHIAVHRYFMGIEQGRFIPEEEAVCDWYDNVYMPLVRIIREKGILKEFPGRKEADLYLWIIDHQHFLREQFGPGVDSEEAADHFTQEFSPRLSRQATRIVRKLFGGPPPESESPKEEDYGKDHPS